MSVRDEILLQIERLVIEDPGYTSHVVPKAIYLSWKNLYELRRESLPGDFGMEGQFQGIPIFIVCNPDKTEEAEPHLVVHGEFE